ncbi:uncharacterized protein [Triticum aestivum]|uniref:uncharacterized protein n=1 Tax=Triticum aestivum TaxID=4565 RepID=UPI001D015374|nr:uncharacterized protein LOC123116823 [Triticum aestivum]
MGICRRVMRATRGGGGGSSMQGGVGSGRAGMDLADGSRIGSMTCGSGESEGRRRRLSSSMDCCSSRERERASKARLFDPGPHLPALSSTDAVVVPLLLRPPGRPAAAVSTFEVSNWFINARVRLWKPMIEEMYQQETNELEGTSAGGRGGGPESGAAPTTCTPRRPPAHSSTRSSK